MHYSVFVFSFINGIIKQCKCQKSIRTSLRIFITNASNALMERKANGTKTGKFVIFINTDRIIISNYKRFDILFLSCFQIIYIYKI